MKHGKLGLFYLLFFYLSDSFLIFNYHTVVFFLVRSYCNWILVFTLIKNTEINVVLRFPCSIFFL